MNYRNLLYTVIFTLALTGSQSLLAESAKKVANPFDPIENLKRLGTEEFTPEAWANAGQEERGRMIWSFFQQYKLSELTLGKIRELLGPSTVTSNNEYSPVNSGLWPAYSIGPEELMWPPENWFGYTLVFIVNPWDTENKIEIDVTPTMLP